jgi:hypothetical protein
VRVRNAKPFWVGLLQASQNDDAALYRRITRRHRVFV